MGSEALVQRKKKEALIQRMKLQIRVLVWLDIIKKTETLLERIENLLSGDVIK